MTKTPPNRQGEQSGQPIAARPARRAVTAALALAAAALTALVSEYVARRYQLGPVDDAYISLRYAANWAAGRGLCFNPGEVVEGYTNFLLVALEAAAIRVGIDPIAAMTLIGRASLAALAALLTTFAYTRVLPRRVLLSVLTALAITLNPILIGWAHSGLESCLYAFLLLATVLASLAADRTRWAIAAGILVVLAAMTRPEGIALLPVAAVAAYWHARRWKPVLLIAGIAIVGYGAYFAIRAAHFGYLLPNTFYAKVDYGGLLLARRGLLHAWDFARGSAPLVLLAFAAIALVRRAPIWTRVALLAAAIQIAVIIYVGGDHFALFRFWVPVVPFLGLAALYPATALLAKSRSSSSVHSVALVGTLVLIAAGGLLAARQSKRGESTPATQFGRLADECSHARSWATLGQVLRHHAQPGESLAIIAVGAVGYFSDLTVIDPLGIVDATVAHRPAALGAGIAGHEKYDAEYLLSRSPGYLFPIHYATPQPVPLAAVPHAAWGELNKQIASDPRLQNQYRYQVIQMSGGCFQVFVRNDLPYIR